MAVDFLSWMGRGASRAFFLPADVSPTPKIFNRGMLGDCCIGRSLAKNLCNPSDNVRNTLRA